MAITQSLWDTVTIQNTEPGVDEMGNEVRVPSGAPFSSIANVQPVTSTQGPELPGEQQYRCFLPPTVTISAWASITHEGIEYEVLGEPKRWRHRGLHHITAMMRRVGA